MILLVIVAGFIVLSAVFGAGYVLGANATRDEIFGARTRSKKESTVRLTIPLLMLTALSIFGQQAPTANTIPANAVVTDGSVSPTAIPDAVALRMFYLMAAPKNGASSTAAPKSLAVFLTQLSAGDKAMLLTRLNKWAAQVPAGIPSEQTAEHLSALMEAELVTLRATLSVDGWKTFEAELARRKRGIKIYQVPSMDMGGK